jgi:hypothetical protein
MKFHLASIWYRSLYVVIIDIIKLQAYKYKPSAFRWEVDNAV